MKRADAKKLREIYDKYASVEKNGERFMSHEDFVRKYLGLFPENNFSRKTVKLLSGILDTSKDG